MHRSARVFGVVFGVMVTAVGVVGCQQPQQSRASDSDQEPGGGADQPDTRDHNGLSITAPLGIQITVNDKGVGVKAPGVDVRSDQDGLNVKAPGVDVRSDQDGLNVTAPGVNIRNDDNGVDVQAPGVSVRANGEAVDVRAPLGVRVRTGNQPDPTPAPGTPPAP